MKNPVPWKKNKSFTHYITFFFFKYHLWHIFLKLFTNDYFSISTNTIDHRIKIIRFVIKDIIYLLGDNAGEIFHQSKVDVALRWIYYTASPWTGVWPSPFITRTQRQRSFLSVKRKIYNAWIWCFQNDKNSRQLNFVSST